MKNKINKKENLIGYLFIAPAAILFIIFVVVPTIALIYLSFTKYNMFAAPKFNGFSNLINLFHDSRLLVVTKNTLIIAVFSVILNIGIGLFLALLIASRNNGIFNYLVRLLFFFPVIVAPVYIAVIWSNIMSKDSGMLNYFLGLIGIDPIGWLTDINDALKSLIGIEVWRLTGFAMLTFIAGIKNISKDYYEASSLDGSNTIQTVFYITIPQLTPIILMNIVLYIINELKIFDIPALMTKGGPGDGTRTITMYIYEMAFQRQNMGYACAVSLLFVVSIMAVTIIQFKLSERWVNYD
jgi:multiple sugar transport system permease protein